MKRARTDPSQMSVEATQVVARKKKVRFTKMPSVYRFNRRVATIYDEWVASSIGMPIMDFKFNELSNYAEYTALFDQYKIDRVEVTFQLTNNVYNTQAPNSASAATTNWFPKLWIVPDYDGPHATTVTVAQIKEYQNVRCIVLQPNKQAKVSLTPKVLVETYKTSGAHGKAPTTLKIDTGDVDVEHYGLLYCYDSNGYDPSDSAPFRVAVEKKFFFSMYGVK